MCMLVAFWILRTVQVSAHKMTLVRLMTDRLARMCALRMKFGVNIQAHTHWNVQHSSRMKSLVTAFVLEILYFMYYHHIIGQRTKSLLSFSIIN
jgi:hypothetical protein